MQNNEFNVQAMKVGDVAFGFQLVKVEEVASVESTVYFFQHEKTKAELLYSLRKDANKTFSIAFETIPEDDTGVFHILEHSVLNGSDKYPVKEPFVNLLQGSMQTFLNAMTFGDKTMYPVCSRNEQDFFNLMSVYLDAVFCPKIYAGPEIFMQEGWHYEMQSPDSAPTYNGVVFSEMKGAFSNVSRLLEEKTEAMLFPDNCYSRCSGGDPESIPSLTYERFIATHKRFYHPSNAKIFLDGEMDIAKVMQYIDGEYLNKYDYREKDFSIPWQKPVAREESATYQMAEGDQPFAHMSMAKLLCPFDDLETICATDILCDYLAGSNEAPLKRAILSQGLAQDVKLKVEDGIKQAYVALLLRNTSEDKFDAIKKVVFETLQSQIENGFQKKALLASLERKDFKFREIQEPFGLYLGISAMNTWLYGGNPTDSWKNGEIYQSLREKINDGYFEELAKKVFTNQDDTSYFYMLPSKTKAQEDAKKEQEKLQKVYEGWTEEERTNTFTACEAFSKWQQRADQPEDLAKLPHLCLKDIPGDVPKVDKTETQLQGRKVIHVKNKTNGIVYANFFFQLNDLSVDELRMLTLVTNGFGKLHTVNYSGEEIQNEIKTYLGDLGAKVEFVSKEGQLDSTDVYLLVRVSALKGNVEKATKLLEELFLQTCYDERDKIKEMVVQGEYAMKQAVISNGHMFAMKKALAPFSAEAGLTELLSGESFLKWFTPFVQSFDDNSENIEKQMAELAKKVFVSSRLQLGYSGDVEKESFASLISALPKGDYDVQPFAKVEMDANACSIDIPADVGYSAIGHNIYALGGKFTGSAVVLSSLVSFGYLWNAVRVQGGAYGTGMSVQGNGNMFSYSYRDPNLQGTAGAYQGVPSFIQAFLSMDMPLDDVIIGSVNATEPLLPPSGVCQLECVRSLKGVTHEDVCKTRKEILGTTKQDFIDLLPYVQAFVQSGRFCGVGNEKAVEFLKK